MGGRGSGRPRSNHRFTTRDIPSILVKELTGKKAPAKGVPVVWKLLGPDGLLELELTRVRDNTYAAIIRARQETRPAVEIALHLRPTLCNYGGSRMWLECPRRGCGRYTTRLFVQPFSILCRQCAGLGYESQLQSPGERRLARIQAIRAKLDAPTGRAFRKPPRMHDTTYFRLLRELRALEEKALADAEERLASLSGRSIQGRQEKSVAESFASMIARAANRADAMRRSLEMP